MGKNWLLALVFMMFAGCRPAPPTLDEEIESFPISWKDFSEMQVVSSNRVALLARIVATPDVNERIRLVEKFRSHVVRSLEYMLANDRNARLRFWRLNFTSLCGTFLMYSERTNLVAVSAGWRLKAEWLDNYEELIRNSEKDIIVGKWRTDLTDDEILRDEFARLIRHHYEYYFKLTFPGIVSDYRRLPKEARPAFAEQIKRDFFHRPGMKYVDLSRFPAEFREVNPHE